MNEPNTAQKTEEKAPTPEEIRENLLNSLKQQQEEIRKRRKEAQEAMGEGRGVLRLETKIKSGDTEFEELPYDFNLITGLEYTEAMDTDPGASQIYRISYRQALALFAKAAAKQSGGRLDLKDIVSRIGATDAVEAVQLATLFFTAATRAGQLRISKKSP